MLILQGSSSYKEESGELEIFSIAAKDEGTLTKLYTYACHRLSISALLALGRDAKGTPGYVPRVLVWGV